MAHLRTRSVALLPLLLAACNAPTPTILPTLAAPDSVPAAVTSAPTRIPNWTMPDHRIGIRSVNGIGELFERGSGEPFVVRGANYAFVPVAGGRYELLLLKDGVYDGVRTRQDFARLAALGYNSVRVFLDHCTKGPGCIGDADNAGLNPGYLDNIADMMSAARQSGLFILFTSNDLPDQGGYAEEANAQFGGSFGGYRNSYYLTPAAISATRRYWRDLLTGLLERQAAFDAVLAWELVNEQWMFADQPPLSLNSGLIETTTGTYDMADPAQKEDMVDEGLIHYIAQMKEEILAHDPKALVTMGFFAPEIAAPGWYLRTSRLLAESDLDFFDFHAYPGGPPLSEYPTHFGMEGYTAKPIVLGEYGPFRHHYATIESAARAVTNWVAESCSHGFDGWLYWTYWPANPEIDDRTWGLTDENGYMLDLLAPVNQPDPCVPAAIPGGNVAYGKPVGASASLPAEPPSNAVDESAGTQWGSGSDAPQWIEVDLQGAYRVTEVRLLVSQYPEGPTVHRVYFRRAGVLERIHDFAGDTHPGDWLIFSSPVPSDDVTAVRVETLSSPSWVAWSEIQVYGETTR